MRRLGVLIATTMLLVILGVVLPLGDALAQQKSLKEQLVGTWIYVSSTTTRADGSKTENLNAEEAKAVVAGSIAYFGTYSIDETDKVVIPKVEGSTYANLIGTDQKRIITSLTTDELRFTNPRTPAGVTLEFVWKRAK